MITKSPLTVGRKIITVANPERDIQKRMERLKVKKEFTDVCYRFRRSSENPFRQQCGMIKKSATGTPCPSCSTQT